MVRGVRLRTEMQSAADTDSGFSTTVVCTFPIEVQDATGAPVAPAGRGLSRAGPWHRNSDRI
ncbi:hypothetical protein [Streptomyces auratus]|uniref:Uncharacterized protein n=1 Tax=Streptomyces auratus AGR0001 TaxID=1160718 RepID=A0A8B1NZ12_9ACTN|nr:hypothetical protein [Streptomyces auratus]QTZ95387.1 hypothetical protein SU9_031265 [Streptomyces auratus AGR0001]